MYWFYWEDNGNTKELIYKIIKLIKEKIKNYTIVSNKF